MISAAAGSDPVAQQIGQSYQNAYGSALAMNQQNYQNILGGYQQTAGRQAQDQAGITAGYGRLSSDVLGGLQGAEAGRRQDIGSAYAQQRGQMNQGMIDRGLGNTTIRSSMERGLGFDEQRAYTDLAGQMAQQRAGYQSQLGLAGLGYEAQAAAARTGQANTQLDWMNSIEAGYPDAQAYGGLLGQRGAAVQGEANRAQAASQFQQLMDQARQNREMQGQQFQQMYGPRQQATAATPAPAAPGVAQRNLGTAYRGGSRPVNQPLPPQAPAPYVAPQRPGGIGAPMPSSGRPGFLPTPRGPQFPLGPQGYQGQFLMPPPQGSSVQGGAGDQDSASMVRSVYGSPANQQLAAQSRLNVQGGQGDWIPGVGQVPGAPRQMPGAAPNPYANPYAQMPGGNPYLGQMPGATTQNQALHNRLAARFNALPQNLPSGQMAPQQQMDFYAYLQAATPWAAPAWQFTGQ